MVNKINNINTMFQLINSNNSYTSPKKKNIITLTIDIDLDYARKVLSERTNSKEEFQLYNYLYSDEKIKDEVLDRIKYLGIKEK